VKEHMASTLGHDGGRQQYQVMIWPLMILATITLLLGFCQDLLELFLKGRTGDLGELVKNHHSWLMYAALSLSGGGIVLAWVEFGRNGAGQVGFVERIPPVKALFIERWYLDRFYRRVLDRVIYGGISNLCTKNDNQVIDGGIHAVSKGIVRSGLMLSDLHMGMIQYKLLVMFVVILLLTLYFFF
jgi:NADH-quinone oxidoreductase subunit L